MKQLNSYTLGLREGGLMEDPSFHIECIRTIKANSLKEAKQLWAEETNHDDQYWNEESQTYWGWEVVEA